LGTTNGCSLGIRSEKVSSLRSGSGLYISDNEVAEKQSSAEELVMARDAIRVVASLKGRQRDSVAS
jgi:hypothetical protein